MRRCHAGLRLCCLPQRFVHLHMAYYPAVAQALQQACGAHFEVLRHERHNVSAGLWRQKP